jgi:hypothetical protein
LADRVEDVVRKLSAVEWTWTAADVPRVVHQLGAVLVEDADERQTYRTPDGMFVDVFMSGGKLEQVEIEVDSFSDVESLDGYAYELKVDEFFNKWESGADAVERVLGEPAFRNGFGNRGFPSDQDAIWLALWNTDRARLMVEEKHEDRDLPFRIVVVAAPPAKPRTKKRG